MGDEREVVFSVDEAGKSVFVAAESGEDSPRPESAFEPLGDDAEKLVAGRVTQSIVDFFEAVEIDQQHPGFCSCGFPGKKARLHTLQKGAPVRETGESSRSGRPGS